MTDTGHQQGLFALDIGMRRTRDGELSSSKGVSIQAPGGE